MNSDDLLSTKQAAAQIGREQSYVRRLCQRGQLRATKVGRDWLIPASALANYVPRRGGRPIEKSDARAAYLRVKKRESRARTRQREAG